MRARAGMGAGDAVYNRDYQGEHSRRLIVLDIQKLLRSGANPACAGPLTAQGSEGTIQKILGPNNGVIRRIRVQDAEMKQRRPEPPTRQTKPDVYITRHRCRPGR